MLGLLKLIPSLLLIFLEVWKGERDPGAIRDRALTRMVKKKFKAINYAERIFMDYTDKNHRPKKSHKGYWKLRRKFQKFN